MPFAKLAADLSEDSKLRKLLTNMIYVGIVAELLGIERDEILDALTKQFKGKKKAIDAERRRRSTRASSTRRRTCRARTSGASSG